MFYNLFFECAHFPHLDQSKQHVSYDSLCWCGLMVLCEPCWPVPFYLMWTHWNCDCHACLSHGSLMSFRETPFLLLVPADPHVSRRQYVCLSSVVADRCKSLWYEKNYNWVWRDPACHTLLLLCYYLIRHHTISSFLQTKVVCALLETEYY